MTMIPDLKEIIMSALTEQREEALTLINDFPAFDQYSLEDFEEGMEQEIFSEDDVLVSTLSTLGLDVEDIDANDFRDYQHQTIMLSVLKFKSLKEEAA